MSEQRLLQVLRAPHTSEKAARVGEAFRQVVFRVARDATKPEIKSAVEKLFGVSVEGVRVVNVAGKRKRFGARMAQRQDWKKAYVTLAPGQDISFGGAV